MRARRLAHIGALQVLQEEGVAADVVVGTSMGAIVGGIIAAGRAAMRAALPALAGTVAPVTAATDHVA